MGSIHFNIESWLSISPGLTTKEQWQSWALNNQEWPKISDPVPVYEIPVVFRRRMSLLSKLALQAALSLVKNDDVSFIIFSSRHGELHRTIKLLTDVLQGDDASPMGFSQSVHNTAAGLLTIVMKQQIPVTSIAAGEHSLHSALIEASAYLNEHPSHRVLVVDFDEPLPAPYGEFEETPHRAYALGMVLSGGDQYRVSWQGVKPNIPRQECIGLPQSLDVIAHLVCEDRKWRVSGQRADWFWKC
ncbi:beta-ketoacyl synthase chain length factor [Photobacterium lutimaris]|uniref:3-oxoacyl-ACP synthase n=1 Tax=Photobacterium lutimaris TaxID=388278 RepID=A0A2T3J3C8_9GAMM|nr:beta-ketoacyl synthase chain length factor [Photobacterium lutimaris]PSU35785.1 3-oxoacyl-ACP synthase [Photobacterium lutimaris]TDR78855.1 beta-ketoacyl synthase-like protein [Photobacterium lutimaris]